MDQAVVKTVKTIMRNQVLLYVWKINQSSANNYHHILTKTLKWEKYAVRRFE
jgi:hypothetical protein